MTLSQFNSAVKLAMVRSGKEEMSDLGIFDGFGLLDFAPVYVTLVQIADLIRWQCVYLSGGLDNEALAEVKYYGRARFNVIG